MPMNVYNFNNTLRDLEERQRYLQSIMIQSNVDPSETKALLKELGATNNLMKSLMDYKQNYIDEKPVKEPKEPKEPKEKKKKSIPNVSYGISGMINK